MITLRQYYDGQRRLPVPHALPPLPSRHNWWRTLEGILEYWPEYALHEWEEQTYAQIAERQHRAERDVADHVSAIKALIAWIKAEAPYYGRIS